MKKALYRSLKKNKTQKLNPCISISPEYNIVPLCVLI